MFSFRKTSFVHPQSRTYYALLLRYFGLKFLPDVLHYVYWVLTDIWAPDSSHEISNKFFIHHCQDWKKGSFVCETVWFFRVRILIRLTWNLSRFVPNSVEILTWNFRKKLFRENFSEILCKPILYDTCEILPYFLKFYSGFVLRRKNSHMYFHVLFAPVRPAQEKFTHVLSCVVCTQVRRHVHKKITKRRHLEEKPWRFLFGKQVLFTLSLGLTTPYSLGILVWNIYQIFFTVSTECWLIFEPEIPPTRLAINFL